MKLRRITLQLLSLLFCISVSGVETDMEAVNKLASYMKEIKNASNFIPQEKAYLHIDNTSYYQGDNIWFKCYIENFSLNGAEQFSKTLYVDLLNPGGEVIDKRVLEIKDGQCNGDFQLSRLPFYSGFYEIRAYTKYMLNFGEDAIFSRLLPVFDKPDKDGNFEEKNMMSYGTGKFPKFREKPQKDKKVNLKFFPEGGSLVQGLMSKVAFEATDELGTPIDISSSVTNANGEDVSFSTTYEGRGIFSYIPGSGKQRATVEYEGRRYQFDLPSALPVGLVMNIDNLSSPDSIEIEILKNKNTPECEVGMVVINRGKPQFYSLIYVSDDGRVNFKVDKSKLLSGVSQIILFNSNGEILCDRLIFTNKNKDNLNIKAKAGKAVYEPYEMVDMEFTVTNEQGNIVPASFSLSVRDGMDEIDHKHNIMTDFLLMSEIKGYVRNPSYYFESDDFAHRENLDLLMMVQGWRRHTWRKIPGIESVDAKHLPEQGIETKGKVVTFGKNVPKSGVDLELVLYKAYDEEQKEQMNDGSAGESYRHDLVTDKNGEFSFVSDFYDRWDMVFLVTEKGKLKDYRVTIDKFAPPSPRSYQYAEMHADVVMEENYAEDEDIDEDASDVEIDSVLVAYNDLFDNKDIDKKLHELPEVTVSAKKRSKEKDIYNNRSKSIAYYDANQIIDDIIDQNKFIGNNVHDVLMNTNDNFKLLRSASEYLMYKGKMPIIVVNYVPLVPETFYLYKNTGIDNIKSIYINEDVPTMKQYLSIPMVTLESIQANFSCVVFIETYDEGSVSTEAGKGIRRTWLNGYHGSKEFYSPDYSELPCPEPDYRRTLYWNPSVTTDDNGKASVSFYNNSRCEKFKISAETLAKNGLIGIYK